jgi:hypothetical protein
MSRKVHIVPCRDDSFPWGKVIVAALLVCAGIWVWHHVLLPFLHIMGLVLVYGAISLGAVTGALAGFFIAVCLVERSRHVRSRRSSPRSYLPGYRLARQDDGSPIGRAPGAAHTQLPTRPLIFPPDIFYSDARSAYPPELLDKARQIIDSQDKTFMFVHGIVPDDIDK